MLTYRIAMQRLTGTVNGEEFDIYAASGGGRGRRRGAPEASVSSFDHRRKTTRATRGGPIPPGYYIVHTPSAHPRLGRSAFLEQTVSSLLQLEPTSELGVVVTNRDGFFVHGRGPRGSDGCIVPFEQFDELLDALQAEGGSVLLVQQPGAVLPATGGPPPEIATA